MIWSQVALCAHKFNKPAIQRKHIKTTKSLLTLYFQLNEESVYFSIKTTNILKCIFLVKKVNHEPSIQHLSTFSLLGHLIQSTSWNIEDFHVHLAKSSDRYAEYLWCNYPTYTLPRCRPKQVLCGGSLNELPHTDLLCVQPQNQPLILPLGYE